MSLTTSTSSTTSTPSASPTAPPPTASVLFARGVIARLAVWPAIRIAVAQGWGGPSSASKRTWLASVLVDEFEQEDPVPDAPYVELRLLQVMEDEFDTVLEDGSVEEVARDVVRLWEEAVAGRTMMILALEDQAEHLKGRQVQVEEGIADDSDWEDEDDGSGEDNEDEDETPMLVDTQQRPHKEGPEVDEDGFTMVKGKGKSHR